MLMSSKWIKKGSSDKGLRGEAGWGSEQPDVVGDVPAHCKGIGLDDL